MTIRLYTSKNCPPCAQLEELMEQGHLTIDEDELEIVDIETDEGFEKFSEEVLQHGDGAVPSAYLEGQKCNIRIDEDGIHFDCPAPSSDSASSSTA